MSNAYASPLDLFDRFDKRTMLQQSNDENQLDGNLRLINRLLDAAAAELESSLYGIWPLPLVINQGSVIGAVAVNGLTFTCAALPSGMYIGNRIVIGPDMSSSPAAANPPEIVQIESISGSAPTITVTISGSGQSLAGQSGGFSFAHGAGAPIGTVPLSLTDYVCTMTGDKVYGRRGTRPDGLDKDVKAKREWLTDLVNGLVSIPGLDRSTQPQIFGASGTPLTTPGTCLPRNWRYGCGW